MRITKHQLRRIIREALSRDAQDLEPRLVAVWEQVSADTLQALGGRATWEDIADEVMAGFGRTGKWFSHQHADVVPDILCMAKGLTSAHLPLGAMGMRAEIAAHFDDNVFWSGLTYSAHAMSLAAGVAAVEALRDEGLVENAARMQDVMRGHMRSLADKHPSVASYRATGLFGAIEFQKNAAGDPLSGYNETHPAVAKLVRRLLGEGVFTLSHWNMLFCNPPLCINEEQLAEAFGILDACLAVTDEAYEG